MKDTVTACFCLRLLVILLLGKELQRCCGWSWIVAGSVDPHAPPPCQSYCMNVPQNKYNSGNWIGIFSCTGTIYPNEQWSYDNITQWIVTTDASQQRFCVDVNTTSSPNSVIISNCDTTSTTQKWIFGAKNLVRNEEGGVYLYASKNSSVIPGTFPLYVGSLEDMSNSGVNVFTLVEESVLYTYVPPPPESNNSNFILNSYLQANYTPAPGVNLPPTVQYPVGADKTDLPFYLCNWSITNGPLSYVLSTQDVHPLLPDYSNFTIVNLNTDNFLKLTPSYMGVLQQVVPTYEGVSYDLSVTVGRNTTSCASSRAGLVQISVQVSRMTNSSVDDDSLEIQNFSMSPAVEAVWENFRMSFTAPNGAAGVAVTISSLTITFGCGPFISRVEMYPSLAVPEQSTDYRSRASITIAAIFGWLLAAVGGVCALWMCLIGRKKQTKSGPFHADSAVSKKLQGLSYSFKEISVSTNNFTVLIGEGGFGKVYRGALPDGTQIAVKREIRGTMDRVENEDGLLYWGEVTMLYRVHHRCVVEFLGYCLEKGERMLIFEFMSNGSLYELLHGRTDGIPVLSWSQRLRIALQVARGLEYLHHGANPPIVHRDIKSANILIAHDFSAKLADLGLSKVGTVDASRFSSTRTDVKGSFGYIDPQYFQTSIISEKSDVYSYGVVLLELISGRKALYECLTLAAWAQPFMEGEKLVEEMVDRNLAVEKERLPKMEEVKEVLEIARACVKMEAQKRPTMVEVVEKLQQICNYSSYSDESSSFRRNSSLSSLYPQRYTELIPSGRRHYSGGFDRRLEHDSSGSTSSW